MGKSGPLQMGVALQSIKVVNNKGGWVSPLSIQQNHHSISWGHKHQQDHEQSRARLIIAALSNKHVIDSI